MQDRTDTEAENPETHAAVCDQCAAPARVCILEGYLDGKPVRRHLCLACAEAADESRTDNRFGRVHPRPSSTSLLVSAGMFLAVLGALVDQFGFETSVGFGLKQQAGLLIGAIAVILGALMRVDIVTVAGTVLLGAAALADVFGPVGSPGVGWQQGMTILVGVSFIVGGLLLRSWRVARRAVPPG